jgi:hypothetical protein
MTACPICGCPRQARFRAVLLKKHDVQYFFCESCGLLQTEEPYWLKEAYSTVIADADTGLVSRNLTIAQRLANLLYWCFDPAAPYLDFSGGYGLLTRLMRDRGFDYYWLDPHCENVFARGFEWISIEQTAAAAVTVFEVLEHAPNPLALLRTALSEGKTSTVIFTTQLYAGEPPSPENWWYYALDTGQHISFFRRDTLRILGQKLGLRFYSNGLFHVLTSRNLSQTKFDFSCGRLARVFEPYVRMKMRSKASDDHQSMIRRSRQCT